ncbi:MAG: HisA/HisF-related TIM barrel protein, partial [Lacticaseibacillus paracasei]|nr:HisA/HisF-related TIM barrel protein [Lacticaseibacillus paracasei]
MKLYPAIDLLNGKSVRLTQGDYDQVSLTEDPLYQEQRLTDAGFAHLHLVDLDGARAQRPINRTVITRIREQTSAFIELGGGIRTLPAMEIYLTIGIDRLILGSAAVSDPDLVEQAIARFGSNRIAVGIDTRAGKVATNGWLTTSQQTANALLTAMQQRGVTTFIVTDIA